jgi:YHS domain-containing protein
MLHAQEIVERYLTAAYGGDPDTARQYLAHDVSFRGPAAQFSGADVYLEASAHARRAVRRLEMHRMFADDVDVAAFYDLHFDHPVGVIAIADWYHLEGDRIASIRTILDTGPFTARVSEEGAVDPVCGMTVAKASAAATRTVGGVTFYFCNSGCAEAFDRQPERYLPAAAST